MPFNTSTYQRGFTLIELLVVVFIISLTAGLMLVNISFDSTEDKIKLEATRLQSLLRFAHEQSIIRAEEYGLRFHKTGYRFMILKFDDENNNEQWIELASDRHLTSRELKNDMQFELFIEDIEVTLNDAEDEAELIKQSQTESDDDESDEEKQKITPQFFLLSSGELTPEFISRIRVPGIDTYFEIQGTLNGEYKLVTADE